MKTLAAAITLLLLTACTASSSPQATASDAAAAPPVATAAFPTPARTPRPIGTLTLTESTCALERAPGPLGPGPASLNVINRTSGTTWAVVGRIHDGKTFEDWARHVEEAAEAARSGRPVMTPVPWTTRIPPVVLNAGGSASTEVDLMTGTYAINCLRTYNEVVGIRPYVLVGPLEVR